MFRNTIVNNDNVKEIYTLKSLIQLISLWKTPGNKLKKIKTTVKPHNLHELRLEK